MKGKGSERTQSGRTASRELVRRAIEFRRPERIPLVHEDTFCFGYHGFPNNRDRQRSLREPWTDEWGCVWESRDRTCGRVAKPALADWRAFESYRFPEARTPERFREPKGNLIEDQLGDREARPIIDLHEKYIMGHAGLLLFDRCSWLRGQERFLMDCWIRRPSWIASWEP